MSELASGIGHKCSTFVSIHPLFFIILVGLAIRFILIPLFSFSFDMSFWVTTGLTFESNRDMYDSSTFWYPPLWGYILGLITELSNLVGLNISGELFANLVLASEESTIPHTTITTIEANVFYKSPLVIIDVVTAWVLYKMVLMMTQDRKKANWAFGLWFLCPLVIWSSAVACMFDSLVALFTIMSIYFLMKGNYVFTGVALAIAISTKVFPICLFFVVFVYVMLKYRGELKAIFKNIGLVLIGGVVTCVVVYLPTMLSGDFLRSFGFFSARLENSEASWNIMNIVSEMSFNQTIQFLPILLGVLILVAVFMYRSGERDLDKNLILYSALSFAVIFFWVPTPTHPVAFVPILIMAILVCGYRRLSISLALFAVIMTIEAFLLFNVDLLFSLAAYTDILDLDMVLDQAIKYGHTFETSERIFRVFELLPALSIFIILWRAGCMRIRKKEVSTS